MMKMRVTAAVRAMALIALLAGVSAAQVKHVAVVETEADPAAKISKAVAEEITAVLRREAINNLPRGKYNIMTNETIYAMGGAVLDKCAGENCVVTLGETIGADYIVRGIVRKIETRLSLTVEMHEIDRGMLIALSDPVRSERIGELLDKAAGACAEMYRKFVNEQGSVTQKASTPRTPLPPLPEFVAPQSRPEPPEPKQPMKYTITSAANPTDGGTVLRNPDQTYYEEGTIVSVTAVPAKGYTFTEWTGESISKKATLTTTIDRDLTLTANFYRQSISVPTNNQPSVVNSTGVLANTNTLTGLKVSYARDKVKVDWNTPSKIANGTVQLINGDGVAISTVIITPNSKKVSVTLGTVGAPTGMYFVRINAVDPNGNKIVGMSAIAVVK
jgi:uncharacterized repeat protein (TIGR02543 family)